MNIDEYAVWASANNRRRTTEETHDQDESEASKRERLAYLGLGLAGESGEVVELIKKFLRDGRWPAERVSDELGDVAYYWACLCIANDRTPSEVLAESVTKIEAKICAAEANIEK